MGWRARSKQDGVRRRDRTHHGIPPRREPCATAKPSRPATPRGPLGRFDGSPCSACNETKSAVQPPLGALYARQRSRRRWEIPFLRFDGREVPIFMNSPSPRMDRATTDRCGASFVEPRRPKRAVDRKTHNAPCHIDCLPPLLCIMRWVCGARSSLPPGRCSFQVSSGRLRRWSCLVPLWLGPGVASAQIVDRPSDQRPELPPFERPQERPLLRDEVPIPEIPRFEPPPRHPGDVLPPFPIPGAPDVQGLAAGRRVLVREVRVEGNTVLPEADIVAVVSPYVGRELSFADIVRLA